MYMYMRLQDDQGDKIGYQYTLYYMGRHETPLTVHTNITFTTSTGVSQQTQKQYNPFPSQVLPPSTQLILLTLSDKEVTELSLKWLAMDVKYLTAKVEGHAPI